MRADIASEAWASIISGDYKAADRIISENYPFDSHSLIPPVSKKRTPRESETRKREFKFSERTEFFLDSQFLDQYTGQRLIFPGALYVFRALNLDSVPNQGNWKKIANHIMYWDLFPTVDHIKPLALGGKDEPENWACTSIIINSIKSSSTLEDLSWPMYQIREEWDGLFHDFMALVESRPKLLNSTKIKTWYDAGKIVQGYA